MTDPLRVLVVARWYPSHDSPGRGIFVADQVRALTRLGVDIVVASWEAVLLTSEGPSAAIIGPWTAAIRDHLPLATPRSWGAGVPVARLPAIVPGDPARRHPVDLAGWQAETLVAFGVALAERWPFDLIHAHTGIPDGVAAARLAERLDLPLLVTEHDGGLRGRLADDRARAAYRGLIGDRRRVVAVSRVLAREAAELVGPPEVAFEVVPNLVELRDFETQEAVVRDLHELLWVGTRQTSKGTDELLGALATLAPSRPGLHLRLIGGAPTPAEEGRLRGLAATLGIAGAVAFEPPADRADVARAMARAGLFVHASPRETFGIVAVEALASGLPVVGVSPAVIDLIGRDGRVGEASEGPDPGALAEAIARALDRLDTFDPEILRQRAAPFDEAVVGPQILARYHELTRLSAPSSAPRRPAAELAPRQPRIPSPLVVGFRRRSMITRLATLTATLAAEVTAVTTVSPGGRDPAPDLSGGAWIEVDPDGPYRAERQRLGGRDGTVPAWRRAVTAIRRPWQVIARRRLAGRRAAMALAVKRDALGLGLAQRHDGGRTGLAIAVDADDALTIDRARRDGLNVELAPASLRWLADRADGADEGPAPDQ